MTQTLNLKNPNWIIIIALLLCVSIKANASTNASYDAALAGCNNYSLQANYGSGGTGNCQDMSTNASPYNIPAICKTGTLSNGATRNCTTDHGWGYWSYTGAPPAAPPPANPCSGMSAASIYENGKILQGSSICVNGPVQADGSQTKCGENINPIGVPTWNPNSGGRWETYLSVVPTGAVCSVGTGQNNGTFIGPDGATPVPGATPTTDPLPPTNPTPPAVCETASCYNAASDQYCASSGGSQVCVPGSSGRSPTGGCASNGDATLCAGSPTAPTPPPANVPDPATNVSGADNFNQSNPQTGAPINVGTTTYTTGGPVTSGAQPGDSTPSTGPGSTGTGTAPASSSSTGGNGSYTGGTDCNSPPACSGDAVACGAAKTQWATTCQLHSDLTNAGTGAQQQALIDGVNASAPYDKGSLWVAQPTDTSVGGQANTGTYDQTGWGIGTTCPMQDKTIQLMSGSFDIPFSKGCVIGDWMRPIIIGFALFAAAKITAGGNG